MDIKKTIIWIIFSFSILVIWNNWEIRKEQNKSKNQKISFEDKKIQEDKKNNLPLFNLNNNSNNLDSNATIIENDVLKVTISSKGAQIIKAELKKYPDNNGKYIALIESKDNLSYMVQSGLVGSFDLPNHQSNFEVSEIRKLENKSEIEFSSEKNNVLLIKKFILENGKYDIEVQHKIVNKTDEVINPYLYLQIVRDSSEPSESSSFYKTFTGMAVFSDKEKFQKISFHEISKNKAKYAKNTDNGWIAMLQHYFVTAWIPKDNCKRKNEVLELDKDNKIFAIRTVEYLEKLMPHSCSLNKSSLWIGPQDQKEMAKVAKGLDLVVDYGIFTIIAKPIFILMNYIFSFVKNWGWSIVIMTLIIKILFFPLASKSYKSMDKLKKISPRIQSLKKQYGDDTQKFNSAVMEMYRNEKINPLGGCLPLIVQIPVFISLYWVLLSSVEMRGAPWILWIEDLSTRDPYFVLPILMVITMIIQIRLNPSPPDPIQAKVMMIMPLVFGGMMFFFPSGLVLYWFVNNLLSIAQQWFITRKQ